MRNLLYKLGSISSGLIILAAVSKINHWPASGLIFTLSVSIFVLGYLCAALIKLYRQNVNSGLKWFFILTAITLLLNFSGILWAVMHWPGKTYLIFASILSVILLFLPGFLFHFRDDRRMSTTNYFYILMFIVFVSVTDALLSIKPTKEISNDVAKIEIELEEFRERSASGSFTEVIILE